VTVQIFVVGGFAGACAKAGTSRDSSNAILDAIDKEPRMTVTLARLRSDYPLETRVAHQ